MPCSDDMIGRQWCFSTVTPWAFIETSSAPDEAPSKNKRTAEPERPRSQREAGQAEPVADDGHGGRRPAAVAMRRRAGERHREQRPDRRHEQRDPELPRAQPEFCLDLGDPRHPAAVAEAVQPEDRGHPRPRPQQGRAADQRSPRAAPASALTCSGSRIET